MEGILFKPDMIKAIAEGRKTQIRRVIKLACELDNAYDHKWVTFSKRDNWWLYKGRSRITDALETFVLTPRYQAGETIYIKEAIHQFNIDYASYDLDFTPVMFLQSANRFRWRWKKDKLSPMFLPYEAARYFIKITDVRAERLADISLSDIYAEGCPTEKATIFTDPGNGYQLKSDAYEWYHGIWDSINKPPYDWQSNPWVFCYEFEKKV